MPAYWLMKSEPDVFSWEMLEARGKAKGEAWDGVRNFQARNNMRAMKLGDLGFFYHSNEGKEVVGIVEVIALAHPDPTDDTGEWECVDVRAVATVPKPVTLGDVKANPKLAKMVLVNNSRLSVQPVTADEWAEICRMGGLEPGKGWRSQVSAHPVGSIRTSSDPPRPSSAPIRLLSPPLVPEIRLHLAEESLPIWQKTEEELGEINVPPPYWAFAWAGGQALARYLLDNPELRAGKRVLDLGSGSGLTAIAAMMAGAAIGAGRRHRPPRARRRRSSMPQPTASTIDTTADDLLAQARPAFDVRPRRRSLLRARAGRARARLSSRRPRPGGALILIGDPQRSYFPRGRFTLAAEYQVPVTRELEDTEIKRTAVWRL